MEYVVKDGEVIIVDEFTGRLMPGRRWSDGLHQAVEAKEGVKIERENQTLATITFQNYFRMYKKLAGMTGTAETEAAEFDKIYKLEVMVIPTNRPMLRIENPDVVYRTEKEKYYAVADEIHSCTSTASRYWSEPLRLRNPNGSPTSSRKRASGMVLNAKFHEKEAEIVAQAGRIGAVTIATNMAGRGTDILLGGNPNSWPSRGSEKGHCPASYGCGRRTRRPTVPMQEYASGTTRAGIQLPTSSGTRRLNRYKAETDKDHDGVTAAGGLVHSRHRTTRGAPHR